MEHSIVISIDEYNNMKAELEKLREIDFGRTISVEIIMNGQTYRLQATPNEAKDTNGFHTLRNKIEYHLKDLIRYIEIYQNRLSEQERKTLDAADNCRKLKEYINDTDNELIQIKKEYKLNIKRYKRIETYQRYVIVVLIALCVLSFFAH